jgi:hypothetical protein
MSVIPALRRQRQEDNEIQPGLHTKTLSQKKKKSNKHTKLPVTKILKATLNTYGKRHAKTEFGRFLWGKLITFRVTDFVMEEAP